MSEDLPEQNAAEPPGLETDQLIESADNLDQSPLCINCTKPIPPERDFCPHCGAANGAYCWLDPWKRIFAEGAVYRRLVSRPIPRFVFGTFAGCLIINMGIALYAANLVLTTETKHRWGTLLAIGAYFVIVTLFLRRVLLNYLKHTEKTEG